MRISLRKKFMLWLIALIAAVYLLIGVGLFIFNQYEVKWNPDQIEEERWELLVVIGIMITTLPAAIGGAWLITGRVLHPLNSILEVADQISEGKIEERLETPVSTDELGHLAHTLNNAFDNYQRLLNRMNLFSLDAAHQLRNPLAAMRTTAEVCLNQPRSTQEYTDTIGKLLDESRRLSYTVDQLLLLARLIREMPEEAFELTDFTALIRDIADNLQAAFDQQGIKFEIALPDFPVRLNGSPQLLEQAVTNLLDNALRITPSGGQVLVELKPRADEGDIVLSISDSGPGFPDFIEIGLLNPDQPTARSANREGSGLGLLIACNVVHAHKGTLEASVSEWNGARFTMNLPVFSKTRTAA